MENGWSTRKRSTRERQPTSQSRFSPLDRSCLIAGIAKATYTAKVQAGKSVIKITPRAPPWHDWDQLGQQIGFVVCHVVFLTSYAAARYRPDRWNDPPWVSRRLDNFARRRLWGLVTAVLGMVGLGVGLTGCCPQPPSSTEPVTSVSGWSSSAVSITSLCLLTVTPSSGFTLPEFSGLKAVLLGPPRQLEIYPISSLPPHRVCNRIACHSHAISPLDPTAEFLRLDLCMRHQFW